MARPSAPDQDFRSVMASVDRRGRRQWIYAHTMPGRWRRWRTAVACVLIAFYLGLPFARIAGGPALRLDIPSRQLHLLGGVFGPQDLSALVLLMLIALVGTVLAVALYGRVFCGWICPHNVFLEMVFRRIETWCEGPASQRRRRDLKPLDGKGIARKCAKWALYVAACGAIGNAFTAFFVGTEAFIGGVLIDAVAHPAAAAVFAALFAALLFNFAWFREQTCTIVCPYGRMQSALTDRDSVVVAYDRARGEPRGKAGLATGDCVDCRLCVQVCPTGIDIRNGNQMECLNCTACIDACDTVMIKLDRKPGLIRYASENELAGKPRRLARARTALTALAFSGLVAGFVAAGSGRGDLEVVRLRDLTLPAIERDAAGVEEVRHVIHLALRDRSGRERTVTIGSAPPTRLVTQHPTLRIGANRRLEQTIILFAPRTDAPFDSALEIREAGRLAATVPLRLEVR